LHESEKELKLRVERLDDEI